MICFNNCSNIEKIYLYNYFFEYTNSKKELLNTVVRYSLSCKFQGTPELIFSTLLSSRLTPKSVASALIY